MNEQVSEPPKPRRTFTTIYYSHEFFFECVGTFRRIEGELKSETDPVVAFERRSGMIDSVFRFSECAFKKANPGLEGYRYNLLMAVCEIVYCLQNQEEIVRLVDSSRDYPYQVADHGVLAIRIYRKMAEDESIIGSLDLGTCKEYTIKELRALPSSSKPSPGIPRLSADD